MPPNYAIDADAISARLSLLALMGAGRGGRWASIDRLSDAIRRYVDRLDAGRASIAAKVDAQRPF